MKYYTTLELPTAEYFVQHINPLSSNDKPMYHLIYCEYLEFCKNEYFLVSNGSQNKEQ
jgi:hypothetical protein